MESLPDASGGGPAANVKNPSKPHHRPGIAQRSGLLFLLLLVAISLAAPWLPLTEEADRLLVPLDQLGPRGPVLFVLLYMLACLLMIPGSILTLAAGFLFGLGVGFLVTTLGSVLGALLAFLLGRTLARNWVENRVAGSARFANLDRAVADRGFRFVFLLRLSPLFPFNLLNYALGLTRIQTRDYLLASWLGMIPGTLLYVYLGAGARNLTDLSSGKLEGGATERWLFYLGLGATALLTLFVSRIASRAATDPREPSEGAKQPPREF